MLSPRPRIVAVAIETELEDGSRYRFEFPNATEATLVVDRRSEQPRFDPLELRPWSVGRRAAPNLEPVDVSLTLVARPAESPLRVVDWFKLSSGRRSSGG